MIRNQARAEFYRNMRRQVGVSQERMAEMLNVAESSYKRWETSGCIPRKKNLKKYCLYFGIRSEDVIDAKIIQCGFDEAKGCVVNIK